MLAQWRYHEESTSIARRGKEMSNERILVIQDFLNKNLVNPKLARRARASSLFSASLLSFYSDQVEGKKHLINSLLVGRGFVPNFKFLYFAYIAFLPWSRALTPIAFKLLKRHR
jgi:hypothetical protein